MAVSVRMGLNILCRYKLVSGPTLGRKGLAIPLATLHTHTAGCRQLGKAPRVGSTAWGLF